MRAPRWVLRLLGVDVVRGTEPTQDAYSDYMAGRFRDRVNELAEGLPPVVVPMNRAPELGPGLGGAKRPALGELNARIAEDMRATIDPTRTFTAISPEVLDEARDHLAREYAAPLPVPMGIAYVPPVLVVSPAAELGEHAIEFLTDRGYTVIITEPANVRLLGGADQVFTIHDATLCREFAQADEADTDALKLMRVAAESLAKRIEDALL